MYAVPLHLFCGPETLPLVALLHFNGAFIGDNLERKHIFHSAPENVNGVDSCSGFVFRKPGERLTCSRSTLALFKLISESVAMCWSCQGNWVGEAWS